MREHDHTGRAEVRAMHNVSISAALIAGIISFLSPCVLPLVPPYLIYLTARRSSMSPTTRQWRRRNAPS